jgi:hypothetical protein
MFTSREIAEFRAYEQAYGPIDGSWEKETLAQMHELLQMSAWIAGSEAEENPMPNPRTKGRPGFMYGFEKDENGEYTEAPEEAVEEARVEQSDGDFNAFDQFFIAEQEKEG